MEEKEGGKEDKEQLSLRKQFERRREVMPMEKREERERKREEMRERRESLSD